MLTRYFNNVQFVWPDIFQSNVEFKKRFYKEYDEEEKSDPPENKPGMID